MKLHAIPKNNSPLTVRLELSPSRSEMAGSFELVNYHVTLIDVVTGSQLVDVCNTEGEDYRFGFNGGEKDNEIKGKGNSLDFGARIYDSRLGRWASLDPLKAKYPMVSPYHFSMNNPIVISDPTGREGEVSISRNPQGGGVLTISTTIFITGENVAAIVADAQNYANQYLADNNIGSYVDENGNKWDLSIKMTFKVATSEDIERIENSVNETAGENLMTVFAGKGRANAGGGGRNYAAGISKEVPSPYYPEKSFKQRIAYASGNTARLYSEGINGEGQSGGFTPVHEGLHLLGLGDRYSDVIYDYDIIDNQGNVTIGTTGKQSKSHIGFEEDIMAHGSQFSQTHVNNIVSSALKESIEKKSDNFVTGRKVDNSSSNQADKVPQEFNSGGATYRNPRTQ